MIRYEIGKSALYEAINLLKAGWQAKAAALQTKVNTRGKFVKDAAIWSEIKPVFMEFQNYKCAYCERALGRKEYGKGEHDLEHFRPKSEVKLWPRVAKKQNPAQSPYAFSTGAAQATGYYWLAYDTDNYATACKSCNSGLKLAYFPVLSQRVNQPQSVKKLNSLEKPLLLFPVGSLDKDPRKLIRFDGIVAVPKAVTRNSLSFRRAQITIDFFDLNGREELFQERFRVIRELYSHYEMSKTTRSARQRNDAALAIDELISWKSPHSACAMDYLELLKSDPRRAYQILQLARQSTQSSQTGKRP